MAQNIKYWTPFDTIKITAAAAHAAGDLIKNGNWYGVCIDDIAITKEGMIAINPIVELIKKTSTDVIASGALIEFVAGGTVQEWEAGTKIGKAHAASGATETKVLVKMMPELY